MAKIGFYPGSFNPWHAGHEDILIKALQVFDHVIIGVGHNPAKPDDHDIPRDDLYAQFGSRISIYPYNTLMVDAVNTYNKNNEHKISAVIRGLRNGYDLQAEMVMQYWNEDLGLKIPQVTFITSRELAHISSTVIRQIKSFERPSNVVES